MCSLVLMFLIYLKIISPLLASGGLVSCACVIKSTSCYSPDFSAFSPSLWHTTVASKRSIHD